MSIVRELKRRNVIKVAIAYGVVAWLLIEITATTFPILKLPDWSVTLVTAFVLIGFPLALIFAWAFEITPEGIKLEKEVDRSQSITHITGRNIDYIIIAALVLALGFFAFDKFVLGPSRDATETGIAEAAGKSIAVLAFTDMSPQGDQEYFSDGISEEILNSLAKIKDLKVAGRTSSFAFKGRNEDLRTIGEALGVSYILEGSVRKAGVKVRITAQLIKADDGFHLWSDTYDRELTDIFAIQDEIAQAIFVQLKARLTGDDGIIQFAASRTDVSAFDLYLEARQKIYTRRRAPLEQAAELLDQAIAIDPGYAPAYAQRGITLMLLSERIYGTIPDEEASGLAKLMFDQALSLDPASAEALAGLGFYYYRAREHEQAIEVLRKSLSINPNLVNANNWLANSHAVLGHLEEVYRIRQEILVRDPLYLPGINNLLDDFILYGEIEKAQALMDRIRPYMPASRVIVAWEGVLHFVAGRIADSVPYFESAHEMEPESPGSRNHLTRVLLYSWQYKRLVEASLDEFHVGLREFRVYALIRLDRIEEASILARELAEYDVGPLFSVLVAQGQYAELIDYVESRWSDLQAFVADYPERDGWSEHNYLGLIALSYQRLGNDEKYEEAMSRFKAAQDYQRQNDANNHQFAFSEAVYAVLAGDHETALSRLARAFEGGFTVDPQLSKTWPMFEPLDGNPRYEAIMSRMVEHVNSERAKLGLEPIERHHIPLE